MKFPVPLDGTQIRPKGLGFDGRKLGHESESYRKGECIKTEPERGNKNSLQGSVKVRTRVTFLCSLDSLFQSLQWTHPNRLANPTAAEKQKATEHFQVHILRCFSLPVIPAAHFYPSLHGCHPLNAARIRCVFRLVESRTANAFGWKGPENAE